MRAESSEGGNVETVYPPDRSAALLYVAIHAGLALIWTLAVLRAGTAGRIADWALANAPYLSYHALDRLFGLGLCAGVFLGRRWALTGAVFYGVHVAVESVYFVVDPYAVVGALAAGYASARLLFLGPRPTRPEVPAAFLPDRIVGAAFALLNSGSFVAFVVHPLPGQALGLVSGAYLLSSLALSLWFSLGVYRARGWSIGTGVVFTTMGLIALGYHPEQRAQMVGSWLGILYFSARLLGLGPRPAGILGVRSP